MGLSASRGTWAHAVGEYVTAMRAAGRSAGTIRLHRYYLSCLAESHPRPWVVSTEHLLAFLAVEHWQPETRKSARGVVRGFYRWAHAAGHVLEDPAVSLPTVRVPAGKPRPTPERIVRALVRDSDRRTAFMAMLAAYGGLRAAEIARVHGRDLVEDVLTVRGKGGKVRAVPVVDPGLLAALMRVGDAWAFPNGLGSHLSPGHVSRVLSRALPEGWTAHTLRHRMGTMAYRGTRDLLAVQQVLGHSRPETTQRYVLLPDDALRAAVAAAAA